MRTTHVTPVTINNISYYKYGQCLILNVPRQQGQISTRERIVRKIFVHEAFQRE